MRRRSNNDNTRTATDQRFKVVNDKARHAQSCFCLTTSMRWNGVRRKSSCSRLARTWTLDLPAAKLSGRRRQERPPRASIVAFERGGAR